MTNYLIRRIIQMAFVVFLAALFTYFLSIFRPAARWRVFSSSSAV